MRLLDNRNLCILAGLSLIWFAGCKQEEPAVDPFLEILGGNVPEIERVMKDPERYELQIRYTRILRQGDSIAFQDHDYSVDSRRYFYPASTVKFPVAVMALEKLEASEQFNRKMTYFYKGDSVTQSFEKDILEVFAVSDNHANNRLFEFQGQDAINDGLQAKGIDPVRISHRLGFHRDDTTTVPLFINLNDSLSTQTEPIPNRPAQPLELEGIRKGVGYMAGDSLIHQPFDFSLKNYLPVSSLHGILKRIIFPETFQPEQRFQLGQEQREFLLEAMRKTPREAGYDPTAYPDGYCKFFMFGDGDERIPENLSIYNKVGFAYGTLTDTAYIIDSENGVEFMLTATILVNENGIFNDNQYEFDTVGIPFLAALGRSVYAYEKAHPHNP